MFRSAGLMHGWSVEWVSWRVAAMDVGKLWRLAGVYGKAFDVVEETLGVEDSGNVHEGGG